MTWTRSDAPTLPPVADVTVLCGLEQRLRDAATRAGWSRHGHGIVALVRPRAARGGCREDFAATVQRWEMRDGVRVRVVAEITGTGRTPEGATASAVLILRGDH